MISKDSRGSSTNEMWQAGDGLADFLGDKGNDPSCPKATVGVRGSKLANAGLHRKTRCQKESERERTNT